MLKNTIRAMIVVTAFAIPCMTFGAQLGPGTPVPDPIWAKNPKPTLGPGTPVPDPIWAKNPKPKLGPGTPVPDPIWAKNPKPTFSL